VRVGPLLLLIGTGCASPAASHPSPAPARTVETGPVAHVDEPTDAGPSVEEPNVAPRSHVLPWGRGAATLARGDSATSGDWEIQWTDVSGELVVLVAKHRGARVGEWKASLEHAPTHDVASADGLHHFEVTLAQRTSTTIAIEGHEVERAVGAKLGQPLAPGLYVFPDGLRLRIEQLTACDFDTSVPCFGGTYRATAATAREHATVEWKTRTAKVLRYTLTMSNMRIVVTQ